MSDIARAWAAAQDTPNRNAHEVLKELAQWADADGETWVLVGVVARANRCTDRTVQRGLADLKRCGLLIDTGEKRVRGGRQVPVYQLPLETGYANLMLRMRAETRAAEAVDDAGENPPMGDSGVTHDDASGVTVVSPHGCQPCHPTGDSGVTQIGNIITQGLTPFAGVRASEAAGGVDEHRETAKAAWGRKAPARMIPALVDAAWTGALASSGWTPARLGAAVTACVARDPDFARGKAPGLHLWLERRQYEAWDTSLEASASAAVGSARARWVGPDHVRQAVAAVMSDEQISSYLDPAGWDADRSVVLARTGYALDQLAARAGQVLSGIGVGLERANG